MDPNGSSSKIGPDRPSVYKGPFWNQSGTDLDPFRTGSRTVPCEHLDRFQTVPCKQKLIQSGSVQNGSSPVHVNIA